MERYASTIRGAFRYGKQVSPEEMEKIGLIIAGCVTVDLEGGRIGKSRTCYFKGVRFS